MEVFWHWCSPLLALAFTSLYHSTKIHFMDWKVAPNGTLLVDLKSGDHHLWCQLKSQVTLTLHWFTWRKSSLCREGFIYNRWLKWILLVWINSNQDPGSICHTFSWVKATNQKKHRAWQPLTQQKTQKPPFAMPKLAKIFAARFFLQTPDIFSDKAPDVGNLWKQIPESPVWMTSSWGGEVYKLHWTSLEPAPGYGVSPKHTREIDVCLLTLTPTVDVCFLILDNKFETYIVRCWTKQIGERWESNSK